MRLLAVFCCAVLASVLFLQAWGASAEKSPEEMLKRYCTVCHNLERVRKAVGNRDQQGWTDYISRMQGKGASITDREKSQLATFLGDLKTPTF